MYPEAPPDEQRDPARFGAWIENNCLAAAVNRGQRVTYWREEPLEVDAVLEGRWGAVGIKSARFASRELDGLFEFCNATRRSGRW